MAGFFERLKSGLSRTAEAVANLLARPMDAESAEQLRERLIAADFGPATAAEVVEAARAAWKTEAALRKTSPAEAAAESIVRALGGETVAAPALSKPHVIMLLGVNGAGKTTLSRIASSASADRTLRLTLCLQKRTSRTPNRWTKWSASWTSTSAPSTVLILT